MEYWMEFILQCAIFLMTLHLWISALSAKDYPPECAGVYRQAFTSAIVPSTSGTAIQYKSSTREYAYKTQAGTKGNAQRTQV